MNVKIAVRHFEPPSEFKEEMRRKLVSAVEKHSIRVIESTAVVSLENSRYEADVNIGIRGGVFHAREEDYDLHECVERVIKKIETQLRRYKDKKVSMKKKNKPAGGSE